MHRSRILEAEVLTDQGLGVVDERLLLLVVEAEPGEVGIAGHLGDGAIECGERRLEGATGGGLLEEELEPRCTKVPFVAHGEGGSGRWSIALNRNASAHDLNDSTFDGERP